MRVWIYGRLSNDDDIQMDSLENQMEIGRCYADSHGYTIVWSLRQPIIEARIAKLREEIRQDEEDIDELLMLKIQRGK